MVTKTIRMISEEEIQHRQQALQQHEKVNSSKIDSNTFVYNIYFDGTNNDMKHVATGEEETNIAKLFVQQNKYINDNHIQNYTAKYYPGHGTQDAIKVSAVLPSAVSAETYRTAKKAYDDFIYESKTYLKDHPNSKVMVNVSGFSRGTANAVAFTKLLSEQGLINPKTNQYTLIPNGRVVENLTLLDPVWTGTKQDMTIPYNAVKNPYQILANDEKRTMFRNADISLSDGSSIETVRIAGNHCDIGGTYGDGLSAQVLEHLTQRFQNAGIAIGNVTDDNKFNAKQAYIHAEDRWIFATTPQKTNNRNYSHTTSQNQNGSIVTRIPSLDENHETIITSKGNQEHIIYKQNYTERIDKDINIQHNKVLREQNINYKDKCTIDIQTKQNNQIYQNTIDNCTDKTWKAMPLSDANMDNPRYARLYQNFNNDENFYNLDEAHKHQELQQYIISQNQQLMAQALNDTQQFNNQRQDSYSKSRVA